MKQSVGKSCSKDAEQELCISTMKTAAKTIANQTQRIKCQILAKPADRGA